MVKNFRAPVDVICDLPSQRPSWRQLTLSKEKVSGNPSLLILLQCTRDLRAHTKTVVLVLCDENSHYRICKLMYGENNVGWNFRLFLLYHPVS